jgi:hypothetical protein
VVKTRFENKPSVEFCGREPKQSKLFPSPGNHWFIKRDF